MKKKLWKTESLFFKIHDTRITKKYNKEFDPKIYEAFINDLKTFTYYPIDFRVSETPLFLNEELTGKFIEASDDLTAIS